jgi:hypothetical protein
VIARCVEGVATVSFDCITKVIEVSKKKSKELSINDLFINKYRA